MKRNLVLLLSLCGLFSAASSCTRAQFGYGGTLYPSAGAALEAQRRQNASTLSEIPRSTNPVDGRALLVLPSRALIRQRGIRTTGPPTEEQIEFIVTAVEVGYDNMADALRKRQIFDDLTVKKSDEPESVKPDKHDVIIYPTLPSSGQVQWFLRTGSPTSEAVPIYTNQTLSGREQMLAWLDYVAQTATEQLRRERPQKGAKP